jgi:hypothetical protein
MLTFKEYLAEDTPYYSSYPGYATHKDAIRGLQNMIAAQFDLASSRVKITPYLVNNKPVFRFKFEVKLTKKHDQALVGTLLQNFAKKMLERSYPKVKVFSDVAIWNGSDGPKALFSLTGEGKEG